MSGNRRWERDNRRRERGAADRVAAVGLLELTNVLANVLQVGHLVLARHDVVGAIGLVRRDEIRVVDRREGHHVLHVRPQLLLQVVVEHLATPARRGRHTQTRTDGVDSESTQG